MLRPFHLLSASHFLLFTNMNVRHLIGKSTFM